MLVSVRAFAGMALASLFAAHLFIGAPAAFANPAPQLVNRDNVQDTDNALFELDQPRSSTTAIVNGTTYLFVGSTVDDGISVFSVGNDGTLTNVDNVDDASDPAFLLDGIRWVTTAEINGTTFLFAAGATEDGVTVFSVGNDGTLTHTDSVDDTEDAALELDLTVYVETAVVNGTTFLFAAGQLDNGVSVFSVSDAGVLTNVDNVDDASDGTFELLEALTLATAAIDGTTYLFVGGHADGGISVFSVANDGTLTHVDSVDSASSTAPALGNVQALTTGVSGGNTYLFAAGGSGDVLSVFYVAADGTLTNVTNVADAWDADFRFDNNHGVSTIVIDGVTYLLAVGRTDDGVSVFSVDANGMLTHETSVTDSDDASYEMNTAYSASAAAVNGRTFLFVPGATDDGLSVFEFTFAVPRVASIVRQTPATSATNADSLTWRVTFDEAVGGVTTDTFAVTGTTGTLAVVNNTTTQTDVTVSGGDLADLDGTVTLSLASSADASVTNVVNVDDDGTVALSGARGLATAQIGASRFLYAAGNADNGIAVFSIGSDGGLTHVEDVIDDGTLELEGVNDLAVLSIAGTTFLFATGQLDAGVSVFSIGNDGTLTNVDNVADDGTLELSQAYDIHAAYVAATPFLFVTGFSDNGVSVFSIANDGTLTNADNVPDAGALELLGASSVSTAFISGTTYLFVTGYSDRGISVFSVAGDGTLTNVDNVDDAEDAALNLFLANDAAVTVVDGTTYLYVAGVADDGISIFSVASTGVLTNVGNVNDDATLEIDGAYYLTINTVGGTQYLYVVGAADDGVSIFSIGNDGLLTNVANIADDATLELDNGRGIVTVDIDGTNHFYVAAANDRGISGFSFDKPFARNVSGNAMTDFTPTGTNDNSFVVDNTAPRVTEIERQTNENINGEPRWTVRFNEDVSNLGIADFTVSGTTGTLSQLVLAPSFLDMDVTGGDIADLNGTVTLSFAGGQDITDLAGNALTNLVPTGVNQPSTIIDNIAPTVVVNIVEDDLGTGETSLVTFEFSEPMSPQAFDPSGTGGTVSNFTQVDADSWTANFTLADGAAEGRVDIDDTVYWDLAYNPGVPGSDTVQRDVTAPVLTAFARNTPFGETTDADTLVFDITFNENMLNVSQADFIVTGATAVKNIAGSGAAYTLTVSGGNLAGFNGTVGLDLAPGHDITDAAGVALGAGEPLRDETYTVLNTGPRIASIERQSPATSPTSADSLTWRVTFETDVTYTPPGAVLTSTDNVTDDATLALDNASWVAAAEVNGTDYVFVTGYGDSGVSVFSVASDGTLTHVETVVDDGTLLLDTAFSSVTAVVGGTPFLFVAGYGDNGISVFSIANDGTLTNVDNVADDGTLMLGGAYNVHTADVGGTTYLFVASLTDSGVSVFSVGNDGTLTNVENVADDATLELSLPRSLDTAVIAGTTYLFVAGTTDDGVSVFSVANDGTLTNVENIADGPGLALDGAHDVTAVTIDGRTYLYVGVLRDDRVQVFEVNAAGSLNLIQTIIDDGSLELERVIALTPTVINNQTYLIAAGTADSGISLFSVANNGMLTSVQNIADDATLQLYGAQSGAMAVVGDQAFFIVVGGSDNGVSVFSLAPAGAASSNFAVAGTTAMATETRVSSSIVDVTASGGDLAGLDGTVTLSVSGTQDFADLAGNALTDTVPTGTNDNTFVLDRTGPRVSSIERETNEVILFQPRWTVRFNENVSNLDASDFTVDGIPGSMVEIDSGANFIEMQSTVAAFNQLSGTATLAFAAGQDITDTLGNALTNLTPTGTNQNTTIIDRTAPTVVVNIVDSALSDADNTSIVTFEFSEPVSGFGISDTTAVGGSLSLFNVVDQDSYSATFTADDNSTTQGSVTVGANSYSDAVGNGGASGTDTVTVDTANPTVAITGPSGPVGGPFTATITYSESVTGLALGEITVGNGAASNLSGSGTTYTATITPDGEGPVTVDVGAGVAIDAAGNLSIAAPQFSVTADTTVPLVASISLQNPVEQETSAEVLTWEIVFSEFVQNISADDFTITGTTATITGFAQQGDATTYRVTISGGNLATESVSPAISFAGDQDITDLAGNALTNTYPQGTNDNFYSVDNDPPIVTDIFAGNNATVGSTLVSWTVSINEDPANLTIDDFTLDTSAGVTATDLQIAADNGTSVTVTANLTGSGTAQLKFDAGTDIVDAFGNGNGTNGFAPAYDDDSISVATVDTVPPRLQSVARFGGAPEATNADTVVWLVTFDTPVRNVDAADFVVTGTTAGLTVQVFEASDQPEFAGISAPAPAPLSSTYQVTASGGDLADLDATVTLGLSGSASIDDANGNALTDTSAAGTVETYTVDNTAPLITGLQRNDPEQTNRDSVSWRIAFDSEMQNLSPDDFAVSGTTATVSLTSINAIEHTVTVSGGDLADLNGTVTLSISLGNNLTDAAGNALGSLVPATDPNEPSYTIDNTGPQLQGLARYSPETSPTSADSLTWRLEFSELVINANAADFSVAGTTGTITTAQPENNIIDVTVSGGDLATLDGTVTLTVEAGNDITDAAGNALTNLTGSSEHTPSFVVDNAAPRIVTIARNSPNTEDTNADTLIWRVTFGEAVGNVGLDDFAVSGPAASVTAVNAVSVEDQPEQAGGAVAPPPLETAFTYNVTVSGGDLASYSGPVTLVPLTTDGIEDAAGNALVNATPTGANQNTYELDNTAPTLTSILRQTPAGEQTNADSLTWLATFSEAVAADAADFAVYGTTATISVQAVAGDQPEGGAPAPLPAAPVWQVTVSGGDLADLDMAVSLVLADTPTIQDSVGNALTNTAATGQTQSYDVRNTAPAIGSISRLTPNASPTNADTLVWRVTFSAIDGGFDLPAAAFTVAGTTATVTDVSRFSIGFDVTVSGGDLADLDGDVTLGLAAADFADDYGNVMDRTIPAGAELTYTVDNSAPTVAITGPAGPVSGVFTATFTFSEAVAGFELADITVGNGAATDLQTSDNTVFTATITPSADGNVTLDVASEAASDAAGNGNTAAGQFSIENDQTAPRIASIARLSPASEQTDADSLTWRVTFSEFVQNVDAGDFQIAGTTATLSVAPAAIAGDVPADNVPPPSLTNTFDVTASGGDLANLNGPVILSALTSGGITDNAGNAFANVTPTGTNNNSYSVINDADAPTVLSIIRRTPSSELTNADSLTWQVSFSEAVENVDAADFAASGTTASVTGVSPVAATLPPSLAGAGQNGGIVPFAVSSQAFEVTVSGGDLAGINGPVRLGFAGAQNIADAAGNALTNTTPAGANQGYTLDNIVPTVTIASSAVTPVTGAFPITITFSEDVTGFDVGDLDLGNGNASNFASSDARTYTATITPGSGATVTVNVAANAASDGAGNGNTAATQFSIGYDNIRTLSVAFTGSGEGSISSIPAGLDCTDDCNADFIVSTEVIVSALAADGSTFLEWTDGPCLGTRNENCIVPMNADRSVAARFQLDEPPAGRIVAATLPAARSGYVGGPVMTAFLSVVSRNETPAQSCYVSAASDAPIALTSQRIDAEGNAIGPVNPNFDIEAGGTVSLVLGMTPTAETDGYEFYPIVLCENAFLDPVQGVNSVSLTIGSAPVPDILSIGVTPSQDGVIRIANSGGAGVMAASAVNIGAGDGSAGPNEVTLTATVDTGATALPLSLELCRIDAAAQCISPRDSSVTAVMAQNDPLFIAVYARDTSGGAGIPFDPANARVFLRFADASGTIRSATSAAVTAPAAADAPELATALPEGRWSVLMRREDGVWPSLTRAALHVASDGSAISDDGVSPRLIRLEGARLAADEPQNGGIRRFTRDGTDGHWTSDGRVLSGGAWIDNAGEFYGVRDARTGAAQTWADFAGAFGDGILISTTGEIRGTVAGCSVYGQSTGSASSLVTLTLSGCASSGGYAGVIDLPANDGDVPVLVIAGERSGWRLAAN